MRLADAAKGLFADKDTKCVYYNTTSYVTTDRWIGSSVDLRHCCRRSRYLHHKTSFH